jgi:hypothetical protein
MQLLSLSKDDIRGTQYTHIGLHGQLTNFWETAFTPLPPQEFER